MPWAHCRCAAGFEVEKAARVADRARIDRLMQTPEMQRQLAWEQQVEARHS